MFIRMATRRQWTIRYAHPMSGNNRKTGRVRLRTFCFFHSNVLLTKVKTPLPTTGILWMVWGSAVNLFVLAKNVTSRRPWNLKQPKANDAGSIRRRITRRLLSFLFNQWSLVIFLQSKNNTIVVETTVQFEYDTNTLRKQIHYKSPSNEYAKITLSDPQSLANY